MNNNKNNNKNNNDIRKENLSNPPERYVESVRRFLNYDRNCGSGMQGLKLRLHGTRQAARLRRDSRAANIET